MLANLFVIRIELDSSLPIELLPMSVLMQMMTAPVVKLQFGMLNFEILLRLLVGLITLQDLIEIELDFPNLIVVLVVRVGPAVPVFQAVLAVIVVFVLMVVFVIAELAVLDLLAVLAVLVLLAALALEGPL